MVMISTTVRRYIPRTVVGIFGRTSQGVIGTSCSSSSITCCFSARDNHKYLSSGRCFSTTTTTTTTVRKLSLNKDSSSRPPALVGALDQGTSSTRFIIFDHNGEVVSSAQMEHKQYYPQPGWVEHDANDIWNNSAQVMEEAFSKAKETVQSDEINIVSIGITNQRETTVVWDKTTGEPLHHAIVWNCARTSDVVSKYQKSLGEDGVNALREKTGLPLSTYFSATKLNWLFDNVSGLYEKANRQDGNVLFGTIDCWLTWKLTNGNVHATDVTNAARTLLCDIGTLQWDDELLKTFNIPKQILPKIEPSIGGNFGTIHKDACESFDGVPIGSILGDQHAATFGQACFNVGDAKSTFGTGAFIMMNTGQLAEKGQRPMISKRGLLTTPFYQIQGKEPVYAVEGAVAVAGSLIQWLRDNLQIGSSAKEIAELAASVEDSQGVRFVPAFAGLFAPHWKKDARGIIAGLTAYHTKAHIARAALDSAAYQTFEVFDAMELDCDVKLSELRVDGGMTANKQLNQFLADILGTTVVSPQIKETTASGVAYAAGLSAGVWSSLDEIQSLWKQESTYQPKITEESRKELKHSWRKAIDRSIGWVEED